MVNDSDVEEGQVYELLLPEHSAPVLAEYRECMIERDAEPAFVFRQKYINAPIVLEKSIFDQMRSDGLANRIGTQSRIRPEAEVDPLALLPADDPKITLKERERRLIAQQRLMQARTLRFYCRHYDDLGNVGRGTVGVRRFISDHYALAKEAGLDWRPSPGALLRALNDCGAPMERPLAAFYDRRGKHDREQRWPEEILTLASAVVAWYWARRARRPSDAIALFDRAYRILVIRRENRGRPITDTDPFPRPHDQTIRNWIKVSRNIWNMEQKYGAKEAFRRMGGRRRPMIASEPLELVMIDHTLIDVWSTVLDENGKPVAAGRLWLTCAIDCYSRMILGAVFTYEHPSLNSVMECLRQVLRRKKFLLDEYGEKNVAADGYGKPATIIVDNGWEFVGTSFQTSCEAANIDVIWAPVKIPMFKAYVERIFGTLNENVWHRLAGGIPLTPKDRSLLELEPEVDAVHDRQRLQDLFWRFVVTRYHMEVHSGINAAPALKWRDGLEAHGRPKADKVAVLDKVMGITKECLLTAEGITFEGQRFHDPKITTELMSELARYSKERDQRKGVTSSRSVKVVATASAGNADNLYVWHPAKRTSIALPNWDPQYQKGTSWYLLRKIQKFAKNRNMAFHSYEDQAAARAAYIDAIEHAPFTGKFAERRQLAPMRDPTPQLVPGDEVVFTDLSDEHDIPQDSAADRTPGERHVSKSPRRGGKKATEKAVRTRMKLAAKKKAEEPAEEVETNAPAEAQPSPTAPLKDAESRFGSPADLLAELMKQAEQEIKR
ncbi:transposase family protein [Devosia lacusdianchii]|uniref:transposase family protein n=1 Tax=Devosia lacusdianchii TaxID=2917991 RepID=UPI001F05AFC7|nr:transposase family protein [Devosia sp. JXJ CY 41]